MQNRTVEIASRQARDLLQALAIQTSRPLDEVRQVYETEFERLDKDARVKIYVPIFAARHTREALLSH
jgi:hypothetical protein